MTLKIKMVTLVIGSEPLFRDHLHELILIDEKAFGAGAWNQQHFMKPLPGKFEHSLFLMSGKNVVGYNILYESGPSTLHISRIAVDSSMETRGYGKQLVNASLKRASDNGYKYITLEFDTSLGVDGFYRKLGFEELTGHAIADYLGAKDKMGKLHLYSGNSATRTIMKYSL